MKVLVTGGCGFLGRYVVAELLKRDIEVLNVDKLTYAGDKGANADHPKYKLWSIECEKVVPCIALDDIDGIIHLAAESHVDNSIHTPSAVVTANVGSTIQMLELVRFYKIRGTFMSTDEVTGSLNLSDPPTDEKSPIKANSPYSASKASCEHLVWAFKHTYGLDLNCVRSTNLFGPYQHPEKFIPRAITYALSGKRPPLYASGENVRDWLWVEDGARGVVEAFLSNSGKDVLCLGARNERANSEIIKFLCETLGVEPESVADRPGHDLRYATDPSCMDNKFPGWREHNSGDFLTLLDWTVDWYKKHNEWWESAISRGGRWA